MPASASLDGVQMTRLSALHWLLAMGWQYVSPQSCLARRGTAKRALLEDSLLTFLRSRRFTWQGEAHAYSTTALVMALDRLKNLNRWPADNHEAFRLLKDGVDVQELLPNARSESLCLPLVDWHDPRANILEVSDCLAVPELPGAIDLVCFLNGIPICLIQCAEQDGPVGVSDSLQRHWQAQQQPMVPLPYQTAQLLMALGGTDARYGSVLSPAPFWTRWIEEEWDASDLLRMRRGLPADAARHTLLAQVPPALRHAVRQQWELDNRISARDHLLCGLLAPERLLCYLRWAIVREERSDKRIARSHQFFAVRALLARLAQHLPAPDPAQRGARAGGVVWHTTGSGKSLTMIFLLEALEHDPELRDCRVIVVTDRLDLQDQLANSFTRHGVFGRDSVYGLGRDDTVRARSGKELAKKIGDGSARLMFAMVHKFNGALMQEICRNPSDKIIVLVDEAHRSQGGELHSRMRRVLKRAAFVGFTGTPLLKHEKTRQQFGPIIHRYTMQRALREQMITPLLYEERQAELALDRTQLDRWLARTDIPARQRQACLQVLCHGSQLKKAASRIEMIAWDIALHFNSAIKPVHPGLKGMIAASSKQDAVRYHHYLNQTGLVTSAVLISPPDADEPDDAMAETGGPLSVGAWWQQHVGKQRGAYEARTLKRYAESNELDLLIVVDRFLTGFDQPKVGVLYLDKALQQHGLLQAIARVNRLHAEKRFGLIVDYRQNLRALDTALTAYSDLEQAQVYDADDLQDLYFAVTSQIARLPGLLQALEMCFPCHSGDGLGCYRQALQPQYEGTQDLRQNERTAFFHALAEFAACVRLAWCAAQRMAHDASQEARMQHYQQRLDFFSELAQLVRHDAAKPPAPGHGASVTYLVDRVVRTLEVHQQRSQYLALNGGERDEPARWQAEKRMGEADMMLARITKAIEVDLETDPYAQHVLGQRLQRSLEQVNAKPAQYYHTLQMLEQQVARREIEGLPAALAGQRVACVCYGLFLLELGPQGMDQLDADGREQLLAMAEWVQGESASIHLASADVLRNVTQYLNKNLYPLVGAERALAITRRMVGLLAQGTRATSS